MDSSHAQIFRRERFTDEGFSTRSNIYDYNSLRFIERDLLEKIKASLEKKRLAFFFVNVTNFIRLIMSVTKIDLPPNRSSVCVNIGAGQYS